jgi:hypothetical protein
MNDFTDHLLIQWDKSPYINVTRLLLSDDQAAETQLSSAPIQLIP